ncbi:hydrophobin 2 [Boletus coccyginus]|nr:hydrophobin 2 [Boletus coccyginus]
MYFHLSTLLPVATLVAVVAAAPSELEARTDSVSQCNTGSMQCCAMTQTSTPTTLNYFSSLLGIALPSIDGLLGLSCSPITAIGTGTGASCTQQPVCCTGNNFNGLINLGCSPINLNL